MTRKGTRKCLHRRKYKSGKVRYVGKGPRKKRRLQKRKYSSLPTEFKKRVRAEEGFYLPQGPSSLAFMSKTAPKTWNTFTIAQDFKNLRDSSERYKVRKKIPGIKVVTDDGIADVYKDPYLGRNWGVDDSGLGFDIAGEADYNVRKGRMLVSKDSPLYKKLSPEAKAILKIKQKDTDYIQKTQFTNRLPQRVRDSAILKQQEKSAKELWDHLQDRERLLWKEAHDDYMKRKVKT